MDRLTELVIQDVRCFQGEQRGRLKPITLLVGENSTGKTTFLGCYKVLAELLLSTHARPRRFDFEPDFNNEPFSMGSFRDIVRSRRGPGGRIDEFKLGMTFDGPKEKVGCRILATFIKDEPQPAVLSLRFQFDEGRYFELKQPPKEKTTEKTILTIPEQKTEIDGPIAYALALVEHIALRGGKHPDEEILPPPITQYISDLFAHYKHSRPRRTPSIVPYLQPPFAIAPLRSKPKRTYDPVRRTESPAGEHVPMLMMQLEHKDPKGWSSLHDDLVAFGKGSGLFRDIKVKRHGLQMSDPFQLQVKVRSGFHANIMDVGYGVSQSLPILVDVLSHTGPHGPVFLLQQPEVHLHPRGQAELASFFVQAFKQHRSHFLIETHSDHIIDRVRVSVKKGLIAAKDVSILYFEPAGNEVNIHSITVDGNGNLENAPKGYRDFFVNEIDELLGFDN